MNARLAWTADLLLRQRDHLQQLTLVNPTARHLETAMTLPALTSLKLNRDPDRDYVEPVLPPPSAGGAWDGARLRVLFCEEGVNDAARRVRATRADLHWSRQQGRICHVIVG